MEGTLEFQSPPILDFSGSMLMSKVFHGLRRGGLCF